MTQNGGTRGGTFHGEMDRWRESQGWTTSCSGMPELDGQDQGEDSPKQASSCWLACPCLLATGGANLYPPGVWFADTMTSLSGITCVMFCFVFNLYAFVEAAALRSIVLRYAGAPIAIRVFSSSFVYLEMSLFPSIFCTIAAFSLYGEYVVRSFLPNCVFLRCDCGLDF